MTSVPRIAAAGRLGATALGVAWLLGGCAAPLQPATEVLLIGSTRAEDLIVRVDGPSRVVLRSGDVQPVRDFKLRNGTATWWTDAGIHDWPLRRDLQPKPERRVVPVADLSVLQISEGSGNVAGGMILGLAVGAAAGVALAPGRGLERKSNQLVGLLFGGLVGTAFGGAVGAGDSHWADRYVFEAARPFPVGPEEEDSR